MAGKPKTKKKDGLKGVANCFIDLATERMVVKFLGEFITNEQLVEAAVILLQVANRGIDNKTMLMDVVSKAVGEAELYDKARMN